MNIPILYEDEHVLVINKPYGIATHPDGKSEEKTVSDWFAEMYPDSKNVGEPIKTNSGTEITKPGVVHRLDKETSGVLILAKDQETFLFLKQQFKDRKVKKIYHAFVYGTVKEDNGTIERPIGKSAKDFRLRSAQRGARGKLRPATTLYRTLQRGHDVSYVELEPKTGRTHQLRAHLKAINHPVVCDKLYAPKRECIFGFTRLALHASSLELKIISGKTIRFEAPFPADFKAAQEMF